VSNKHYVEVALYQLKSDVGDAQFLAVSDEATINESTIQVAKQDASAGYSRSLSRLCLS